MVLALIFYDIPLRCVIFYTYDILFCYDILFYYDVQLLFYDNPPLLFTIFYEPMEEKQWRSRKFVKGDYSLDCPVQ